MGGTANTPAEAATTSMRYRVDTKNQSYTAGVGAYQDHSSNSHTVTANGGAAVSTTQTKVGTHTIAFDGTGDYLSVGSAWDYTGDSTTECWLYLSAMPGNGNAFDLFSTYPGSGTDNSRIYIQGVGATGAGIFFGKNGVNEQYTGDVLVASTWYHIAWVRSGSTNTIYLNGVSQSLSANVDWTYNATRALTIGSSSSGQGVNGYMDEIRISNSVRYATNFTDFGQDGGTISSPTNFTSDSNTKLLIHGEAGAASGKITRIHGTSLAWS
jgi:hypothetical protein